MAERCPNPVEGCRYAGTPECLLTEHHLYWPAPDYTTELEVAFRGLLANREQGVPRCVHDTKHTDPITGQPQPPPEKPSIESMAKAVVEARGEFTSVRRKRLVQRLIERELY